MRTVSASFNPFFASELGTASGKTPVVMKGPDDGNVSLPQIIEKHGDVEIIVTQRMNVNQIWSDLFQSVDEKPGIDHIEIAV